MSGGKTKECIRCQSLIWELHSLGLEAAWDWLNFLCVKAFPSLYNLRSFFVKDAAILVSSDVKGSLCVTLFLHAGEEAWRCLGCGDSIAAGQRLYKTVNEAWHISCFR